ncbi:MAG: DsrE family protein [Methylococcales bacterium]|nr:DsrE family protein [Methylococcales bacterium]
MTKTVLYQISHDGILAEEALDSAMTLAAFGLEVAILLQDQGARLLTEPVNGRLKALPLYDIDTVWIEASTLTALGLKKAALPAFVQVIDTARLASLAAHHDVLLH